MIWPKLCIVIVALICGLTYTSAHSINKRAPPKLVPTLTVDVSPSHTQIPVPFDTGKPKEYYFPVGELFNVSCVIKNPSFMHHLSVSRRTIFNNGSLDDKLDLLDTRGYEPNPLFPNQPERLQVQTREFYPDYDQQSRHIRVSVIVKALDISDTGFYKCEYQDIVKEIKITVFKQAHSNSIVFPVTSIKKSLKLGKPTTIGCRVNEVYPKPTVSFALPDGNKVNKKQVKSTDLSPQKKGYFTYTELAETRYSPKFSDHNKNLSCEVFTIGSTNLTINKNVLISVEGFALVSDQCIDYFTGDVNDLDVEYSCTFFSNPKIMPSWSTKASVSNKVVDEVKKVAKKIATDSVKGDKVGPENLKMTTPELTTPAEINEITISEKEKANSNYVSSIEELENGLFKAKLRIKKVGLEDYKDYKLKFTVDNKVIEHVVSLKKTGYDKRLKALAGSASFLTNNIVHSTLIIAVTSLLNHFTR